MRSQRQMVPSSHPATKYVESERITGFVDIVDGGLGNDGGVDCITAAGVVTTVAPTAILQSGTTNVPKCCGEFRYCNFPVATVTSFQTVELFWSDIMAGISSKAQRRTSTTLVLCLLLAESFIGCCRTGGCCCCCCCCSRRSPMSAGAGLARSALQKSDGYSAVLNAVIRQWYDTISMNWDYPKARNDVNFPLDPVCSFHCMLARSICFQRGPTGKKSFTMSLVILYPRY
jgi:hypothetical protein